MKKMTSRRSSIRRSTTSDLKAIHVWLLEEDAQDVHGNFLCNWSFIESSHRDGALLVYIDGPSGLPVAFQLGGLIRPGILQVRNAYRGMGIGRKMVERCKALALKRGESLLYIQCKPSSSIPFWKHMGFTLIEGDGWNHYAYQVLDKALDLPAEGEPVSVQISFYPHRRKWEPDTAPYSTYSPQATRTANGTIHLAQRIQFHEEAIRRERGDDLVVEVTVDGHRRYLDKAKYSEAKRIGVRRCMNGSYIDAIFPEETATG